MGILILFFFIGLVFVNLKLAHDKKRNVVGVFFLSVFFTPVLPFLYLLASPVRVEEVDTNTLESLEYKEKAKKRKRVKR